MAGVRPVRPRVVVVSSFALIMVILFSCAFLLERTVAAAVPFSESNVPMQYKQIRQESSDGKIFAVVKGSIYETGSNMTVFGACEDAFGYLIPGSSATFSAWYPNGTLQTANQSMLAILDSGNASGRFRIHITMPSTIGTYFTEMRCEYGGQYALAYGEWQNPEWVFKIGQTLLAVVGLNQSVYSLNQSLVNISNKMDVYQNTTQQNLSAMMSLLQNISSSPQQDYSTKLKEIYNLKYDLNHPKWVMDEKNTVYTLGSGQYQFSAVDVVDRDNVVAVALDGQIAHWNGVTWSYSNVSNVTFMGVSLLNSPVTYYWAVGMNGTFVGPIQIDMSYGSGVPIYSIVGGPPQVVNETWFVNASSFVDVKVFNKPNRPIDFYAFLLADNGQVLFSDTGGVTWNDFLGDLGVPYLLPGSGRMSNVVANTENTTEGYRIAFVTGSGSFAYFNGTNISRVDLPNVILRDVALLRDGVAYAVGWDTVKNTTIVFKYNQTANALSRVYETSSAIMPAGIAVVADDDIWVATQLPSTFFHYDGFKWEYVADPFTEGLGVVISFSSQFVGTEAQDLAMSGGAGYTVGTDGVVMKFWSVWDNRFDEVLNVSNSNYVSLNNSVGELKSIVLSMNSSLMNELNNVNVQLGVINSTQQQVLSNVTYISQYLSNVVGPALTNILAYLGIMDAKLNTTIELQNQTLQIVNATNSKVDDLVAKSERPHTWTTQ